MTDREFPRLALVEQRFEDVAVADVEAAVRAELARVALSEKIRPGQSVAVTAGSRGIHAIDRVLRAVCRVLKELGARPFLFPAMGSHGGATAEGQTELLRAKGLDETNVGAPVFSCMDTFLLGVTEEGFPVHVDGLAAAADHILVVNRVKAHTKFKGRIESGLCKMLAIGAGKHAGAATLHRLAVGPGLERVILSVAGLMLAKLPVLCGLGLVENAHGSLAAVRALPPAEIIEGEAELLRLAKRLAPKLPCREIDLLVVDVIGKDISGTGMDPNVTGRNRDILGDFSTVEGLPRTRRILARDLSPGSSGNAHGLELADFVTSRLVRAMDRRKTVVNALASLSPEKAAIPVDLPDDRSALAAALDSLGRWDAATCRLIRIRDTSRLERLLVSEALLPELPSTARLLSPPASPCFDAMGDLPPFPESDES